MKVVVKVLAMVVLLVGVLILVVLAGLELSMIGSAKERSRAADCANNLRQLGLALHVYADDHKERFPDELEDIWEYAKQTDLLICPSANPKVFSKAADWSRIAPSNSCYYYVAGGSLATRKADEVHMFELPKHHERAQKGFLGIGKKPVGGSILYVSGHVRFYSVEGATNF